MPRAPKAKNRIAEALNALGRATPAELEDKTGLNGSTIRTTLGRMVREGTASQDADGNYYLLQKNGTPGANGPSRGVAVQAGLRRRDPDLVYIPLSSLASAGDGEFPFSTAVEEYLAYSREQLRRDLGGVDPERLHIVTVTGNSMRPTLWPGDRVLVAEWRGERIMDGAIYVFANAHAGVLIKRARWHKDGSLSLRSDNRKDAHDFTIAPGEEHEWKCVGRVVRVEKSL